MKRFAQLFRELDQTTRTSGKLAALESYFHEAPTSDAAWALHFLMGRRGRRPVKTALMRTWVAEASGFPDWLVEECYDTVGDLAETLSLLMPVSNPSHAHDQNSPSFTVLIETRLLPLTDAEETTQRELFISTLRDLDRTERFLFLKLLTGGFRMGVARTLVVRALANVAGLSSAVMQHRLMGNWKPTAEDLKRLTSLSDSVRDPAQPYPFHLASPIEQNTEPITDPSAWQTEWKWDGIRAQLIRRDGQTILWSRGEEVITPGYPEIELASRALPDGTVLDGELLAWRDSQPLSFNELQKRLGRKTVSKKVQATTPVVFMAYDLLEHNGEDVRNDPLSKRRERLEVLFLETQRRFDEIAESLFPPEEKQGELFAIDANGALVQESDQNQSGNAGASPLTVNPSPQGKGGTIAAATSHAAKCGSGVASFTLSLRDQSREGSGIGNLQKAKAPSGPSERARASQRAGVTGNAPQNPAKPISPSSKFSLFLSPMISADTMDELAKIQSSAREMRAEGLMLKRLDSVYGTGRVRGHWWKWKVDPFTVDAVLIAAQPGHGKRAGLFTDYTFGIWKEGELLSFAKAYSGLTDAEIQKLDKWVRENTTGRHGPVRTVKPELVFELAFDNVQESNRHKSGIALRFPRIRRWRNDKTAVEADQVQVLRQLLV